MHAFGSYALIGFCVGLIWGVGCAVVLLYSIYLAGYRKAIHDSLQTEKPERYLAHLEKLSARNRDSAI